MGWTSSTAFENQRNANRSRNARKIIQLIFPANRNTHVIVRPGLDVNTRALLSANVSLANSGSSLISILYFDIISVRIAIPSVSKNLKRWRSYIHKFNTDIKRTSDLLSTHTCTGTCRKEVLRGNQPNCTHRAYRRWREWTHLGATLGPRIEQAGIPLDPSSSELEKRKITHLTSIPAETIRL
jgi:hypothetical protein